MSNYQYGKDILKDVLFRGGEKDDLIAGSTDYLETAKKYIMRSYYDMISEYPFPSSLSNPPGVINTVGKVTGTATSTTICAGSRACNFPHRVYHAGGIGKRRREGVL